MHIDGTARQNWLRSAIDACLARRWWVLGGAVLLTVLAGWRVAHLKLDALPDLSETQVIVKAEWAGQPPRLVEDQITYPLTVSLQGLPGVRVVRSSSAFGFSMINVIFEDNVDLYFARSRVLERLQLLSKSLPPGTVPTLGPDATGVGHVFWYTVEGKGHTLRDLRSIQDWFIRYQLNAVPGVAEVASIGGFVRQWQVEVSALKLKQYDVMLGEVMDAVAAGNLNVGGKTIEENGAEFVVRGVGLVQTAEDLEAIVVKPSTVIAAGEASNWGAKCPVPNIATSPDAPPAVRISDASRSPPASGIIMMSIVHDSFGASVASLQPLRATKKSSGLVPPSSVST